MNTTQLLRINSDVSEIVQKLLAIQGYVEQLTGECCDQHGADHYAQCCIIANLKRLVK